MSQSTRTHAKKKRAPIEKDQIMSERREGAHVSISHAHTHTHTPVCGEERARICEEVSAASGLKPICISQSYLRSLAVFPQNLENNLPSME